MEQRKKSHGISVSTLCLTLSHQAGDIGCSSTKLLREFFNSNLIGILLMDHSGYKLLNT